MLTISLLFISYVIVGFSFVETNGLWMDVWIPFLFLIASDVYGCLPFLPISRHFCSTLDVLTRLLLIWPLAPPYPAHTNSTYDHC